MNKWEFWCKSTRDLLVSSKRILPRRETEKYYTVVAKKWFYVIDEFMFEIGQSIANREIRHYVRNDNNN